MPASRCAACACYDVTVLSRRWHRRLRFVGRASETASVATAPYTAIRGMSRILVAEDDADIAALVRHYLEKAGFDRRRHRLGPRGDAAPAPRPTDLLVLDLMLPGMDGLDVCRALRGDPATAAVPIIMLTAKAEESDRIAGLELGADDYITKPFSPRRGRGRACGRCCGASTGRRPPPAPSRYGPLTVDVDRHVVTADGARGAAHRQGVPAAAVPAAASRPGAVARPAALGRLGLLRTPAAPARSTCTCGACARSCRSSPRRW